MSGPSFTSFVWAAREAMSLYYYALGRKAADIKDADRELNQTLDTTYIGFGLACWQLRTAENIVRCLEAGLRRALVYRWPSPGRSDAKFLHEPARVGVFQLDQPRESRRRRLDGLAASGRGRPQLNLD